MAITSTKYEHSGNSGHGFMVIPLVAIPATLLLSVVYGYVCVYNPFAGKISFLIPVGYGIAIGYCILRAVILSKCRNKNAVYAISIGMGVFALYCGWAAFIYALIGRSGGAGGPTLAQVYLSPVALWNIALAINNTGWYSVFGGTPSGIILWIFWVLEAGIIIVCTVLLPLTTLQKVFCETCDNWCDEKEDIARFEVSPDRKLMDRVKGGDLLALAELRMSPAGSRLFLRVDSQRCKSCQDTATFAVKKVSMQPNKEGKLEASAEDICDPMVLTPDALQQFQQALVKPSAVAQ